MAAPSARMSAGCVLKLHPLRPGCTMLALAMRAAINHFEDAK
jgi:hypothetical protein